jgi:hypothetical protein
LAAVPRPLAENALAIGRPCSTLRSVTSFLVGYVVAWSVFCLAALVLAIATVRVPIADAVAFLRVPWKVALFVPAIVFVTFAGRFTDDETWDVVSGGGMSVLTVGTAWWSIGTAVRVFRRLRPAREIVVALAVMLFSSSWFYDGYLLLRDGAYTQRWLGNLMLSPTIYLCAGLVANFETRDGKLALAFTREDWPRPLSNGSKATWSIGLAAMPLVAIAAYFLAGFVGWRLP